MFVYIPRGRDRAESGLGYLSKNRRVPNPAVSVHLGRCLRSDGTFFPLRNWHKGIEFSIIALWAMSRWNSLTMFSKNHGLPSSIVVCRCNTITQLYQLSQAQQCAVWSQWKWGLWTDICLPTCNSYEYSVQPLTDVIAAPATDSRSSAIHLS